MKLSLHKFFSEVPRHWSYCMLESLHLSRTETAVQDCLCAGTRSLTCSAVLDMLRLDVEWCGMVWKDWSPHAPAMLINGYQRLSKHVFHHRHLIEFSAALVDLCSSW